MQEPARKKQKRGLSKGAMVMLPAEIWAMIMMKLTYRGNPWFIGRLIAMSKTSKSHPASCQAARLLMKIQGRFRLESKKSWKYQRSTLVGQWIHRCCLVAPTRLYAVTEKLSLAYYSTNQQDQYASATTELSTIMVSMFLDVFDDYENRLCPQETFDVVISYNTEITSEIDVSQAVTPILHWWFSLKDQEIHNGILERVRQFVSVLIWFGKMYALDVNIIVRGSSSSPDKDSPRRHFQTHDLLIEWDSLGKTYTKQNMMAATAPVVAALKDAVEAMQDHVDKYLYFAVYLVVGQNENTTNSDILARGPWSTTFSTWYHKKT